MSKVKKEDLKGLRFETHYWKGGDLDVSVLKLPNGEAWFDAVQLATSMEYGEGIRSKVSKNIGQILGDNKVDEKNVLHLSSSGIFLVVGGDGKPMVRDKTSSYSQKELNELLEVEEDLHSDLGRQGGYMINLQGFHQLLNKSTMPKAGKFRKWVVNDLLTTVDRHGSFAITDDTDSDMAGMFMNHHEPLRGKEKRKFEKKYQDKPADLLYNRTECAKNLGYTIQAFNEILGECGICFKKKPHLYLKKYTKLFESGDWLIVGKTPYFTYKGFEEIKKIVEGSDYHKSRIEDRNEYIDNCMAIHLEVKKIKKFIKNDNDKEAAINAWTNILTLLPKIKKGDEDYYLGGDIRHVEESKHAAVAYVSKKKIKEKMDELVYGPKAPKSKKKKSKKDDGILSYMSLIKSGKKLKGTMKDDGTISISL